MSNITRKAAEADMAHEEVLEAWDSIQQESNKLEGMLRSSRIDVDAAFDPDEFSPNELRELASMDRQAQQVQREVDRLPALIRKSQRAMDDLRKEAAGNRDATRVVSDVARGKEILYQDMLRTANVGSRRLSDARREVSRVSRRRSRGVRLLWGAAKAALFIAAGAAFSSATRSGPSAFVSGTLRALGIR